jgi:hypothetical protein
MAWTISQHNQTRNITTRSRMDPFANGQYLDGEVFAMGGAS